MINRVTMIGRLTRDPEVRATPNGSKITKFGVATNKAWKNKNDEWCEKTTFSDWLVWNGIGENFARNAAKGDLVYLEGEYGLNEWEVDGEKRTRPEFTAFTVRLLSKAGTGKPVGEASDSEEKSEPPKVAKKGRPSKKAEASKPEPTEDNDDSKEDDDIPF